MDDGAGLSGPDCALAVGSAGFSDSGLLSGAADAGASDVLGDTTFTVPSGGLTGAGGGVETVGALGGAGATGVLGGIAFTVGSGGLTGIGGGGSVGTLDGAGTAGVLGGIAFTVGSGGLIGVGAAGGAFVGGSTAGVLGGTTFATGEGVGAIGALVNGSSGLVGAVLTSGAMGGTGLLMDVPLPVGIAGAGVVMAAGALNGAAATGVG